jgi:hypothetical protein
MESETWGKIGHWPSVKILAMIPLLRHFLGWLIDAFRPRQDLILENLALRQQLMALHAGRPRPRLRSFDKLFWVALRKLWSGWKRSLILVTPETVVRWHRTGFQLYWAWLSRAPRTGLSEKSLLKCYALPLANPRPTRWNGNAQKDGCFLILASHRPAPKGLEAHQACRLASLEL